MPPKKGSRTPAARNRPSNKGDSLVNPQPRKRRRLGQTEIISNEALSNLFDSAIASQGGAERAALYLMEKYDLDLDALRSRIRGAKTHVEPWRFLVTYLEQKMV
jgi:hypothetical protein